MPMPRDGPVRACRAARISSHEYRLPKTDESNMTLTLRAVSLNDHPLTQPITAHFDAQGGSVGRSDHNTLALPDPERHISRQHAEISVNDGAYVIKNVGSANPIIVRGLALARGDSAPLLHRDQIRIGGYLLEVIHEDVDNAEASTIARGRAAVDARTPVDTRRASVSQGGGMAPRQAPAGNTPGLGDLGAPLSRNNPFAELLGDPVPAPSISAPPAAAPFSAPPYSAPTPAPSPSPFSAPASSRSAAFSAAPPPPAAPRQSARPPQELIDPFFDPQPAASGVPSSSSAWASAPPAVPHQLLPDDFDPLAPPTQVPAPRPAMPSSGGGTFDDLIPNAAPASIDQMFDLQPGSRDPLADFMADFSPSAPASNSPSFPGQNVDARSPVGHLSTDPLALFGGAQDQPVRDPGRSSASDNVPELRAAFVPPAMRANPAPIAPPPPVAPPAAMREAAREPMRQPAAAPPRPLQQSPQQLPRAAPQAQPAASAQSPDARWSGDPRELWSAFCEGAGISLDPPQGVNPELMRVIGGLLRSAVTGTLQLMMVRATTKHELRAEVTIIQARNNNPLKFSPDARSALEQMLQPPMRGFLAGPAAMTDAMHDLVGHTIGTMAGTRAALEGVLDRFTPQELEAKLVGKTMLDSLLPMNRKAKLWELYLHHFDTIRNEAHDDFHTLFGRAFLAAYEQQLDRLQSDEQGSK
jgi:FHA domain-containing protein